MTKQTNTTESAENKSFKTDLLRRLSEVKKTRWIRFAIVALIFIAWVAWLGNWWVILLLPLLFDIYITGYIPFTWWKKSKNKTLMMVMSWVDAIVYALILVYFVFTFIGQNYQIPSPSLEKTLLTGDYLWVSKMSYGARVPFTPIHFPLVQNTMPFTGSKSYTEWPSWDYHRLSGLGEIEAGDIVVFNFPAGDTVMVAQQNPDYYTLKKVFGNNIISENPDYLARFESMERYDAERWRDELGKNYLLSHPELFGEMLYRPVDRRENYVKRAVGLPGQTLTIVDGQIHIDGKPQQWPTDAQFNYLVQTSLPFSAAEWEEIGVSIDDRQIADIPSDRAPLYGLDQDLNTTIYDIPLSNEMLDKVQAINGVKKAVRKPASKGEYLFPDNISDNWTRADYGPVMIPRKGQTIAITPENWYMYERAIRDYEGHSNSYLRDGKVFIDGQPADSYTFAMDYYFMMGDNRDNSLDSRYWGFVPEDHIVGKPIRILISFDKDKSIFNGGIRWNRIFKNANPGF